MVEWKRRGRGEYSKTPWSTYDPSHAIKYTYASFPGNYRSETASLGDLDGFAASSYRNKVPTNNFEKLMLYEDPEGGHNTNKHARHTNDSVWGRVPLADRGSILSGKFPPPDFLAEPYQFWIVNADQVSMSLLGLLSSGLRLRVTTIFRGLCFCIPRLRVLSLRLKIHEREVLALGLRKMSEEFQDWGR